MYCTVFVLRKSILQVCLIIVVLVMIAVASLWTLPSLPGWHSPLWLVQALSGSRAVGLSCPPGDGVVHVFRVCWFERVTALFEPCLAGTFLQRHKAGMFPCG